LGNAPESGNYNISVPTTYLIYFDIVYIFLNVNAGVAGEVQAAGAVVRQIVAPSVVAVVCAVQGSNVYSQIVVRTSVPADMCAVQAAQFLYDCAGVITPVHPTLMSSHDDPMEPLLIDIWVLGSLGVSTRPIRVSTAWAQSATPGWVMDFLPSDGTATVDFY